MDTSDGDLVPPVSSEVTIEVYQSRDREEDNDGGKLAHIVAHVQLLYFICEFN